MQQALLAFLASVSVGHATLIGLSPTSAVYATWDNFPAFQFSGDAPDFSAGMTSPILGQSGALVSSAQGAGLYQTLQGVLSSGPSTNDVLFTGGNAVNFSVTGSFDFTGLDSFTLQMKRPGSASTLADRFTPTLSINGGTAFSASSTGLVSGTGDTSADSPGTWAITTWTFDLPMLAGMNTFGLAIPSTVNGNLAAITRGVDFVSVQAIPEPSTNVMLFGGFAMMGIVGGKTLRRLKKKRTNANAIES